MMENEQIGGQAAQEPPCIHSHDQMYLTWRNQGNGYNYFYCPYCTYVEFDFETGKIKKALDAKDLALKDQLDAGKLAGEALKYLKTEWSGIFDPDGDVGFAPSIRESYAKLRKVVNEALDSLRKVGLV